MNLVDLVVRTAEIGPDDLVLEVGTGTGVLTERLAAAARRVVSCEIDPRLAQLARDRLVDRDNVTSRRSAPRPRWPRPRWPRAPSGRAFR